MADPFGRGVGENATGVQQSHGITMIRCAMDGDPETFALLSRWHGGDPAALDSLVRKNLPWIRQRVERRVGDMLREKADVDDFVQEAMVEVLRYGPRFSMSSTAQFRTLLAKIIENVIRDKYDKFTALRREMARERPVPRDTLLNLDPPAASVTRPSQNAQRDEGTAWVRLGLELLSAEQREVLILRQWEGLGFKTVGERLGVPENTARMRFQRALKHLGTAVMELRAGRVGSPE